MREDVVQESSKVGRSVRPGQYKYTHSVTSTVHGSGEKLGSAGESSACQPSRQGREKGRKESGRRVVTETGPANLKYGKAGVRWREAKLCFGYSISPHFTTAWIDRRAFPLATL